MKAIAARYGLLLLLATGRTTRGSAQNIVPTLPDSAELVRRLGAAVDSLARADRFSGVVLLSWHGSPIFQRASGLADRDRGAPNTLETRFNLGSINKVFTATAIRQLALQGKVGLDSTLGAYLPDYPNRAVAEHVTLRQLLEHRSGIGGDIFDAPSGKTRAALRTNGDFIPLFSLEPPHFAPGADRRYSNAGYVLLGAVIERVSGVSYYDFVRDHIFVPAGMTATGSYAKDSLPPNTAIGYTRGESGGDSRLPFEPNTDLLPGRGSAAGGGYSTAGDLLRFAVALDAHAIPGAPSGGIGVAGGAPGINALLETGLPGGYTLVVLGNLDPPAAEGIGRLVRTWLGVLDD